MSKSSFFYQAETLHGCEKFKKSTGSQSSSIIASKMANIFTSENFGKSVGGNPSHFELHTIWLLFSIAQGLNGGRGESKRVGVIKNVPYYLRLIANDKYKF